MPTTAYNISMIQRRATNYSRPQILDILNEVQQIVYSQETEQTTYIDPATGMPPYIQTTEGVYTYDAPSNCRRTACVFSMSLPNSFSRTRPVGPRREYYFRNKGYYKIAVASRDKQPDGTLAQVIFQEDPGTTTDKYYHSYWLEFPELLDESQQLILPDHVHFYLRRAVIAMISNEEYGETGGDIMMIEEIAKKIRKELNRGEQSTLGQTPVMEEYQEFPDAGYDNYRF
jgi:hypothetical protein